jgi:galactonate dehydratase
MKITKLTAVPTVSPISDWVYVRVDTDQPGLFGWGECSLPTKPNSLVGAVADLEKLVVGADPRDTEWCWQRMYRHAFWRGGPIQTAALSGVDIALWDIRGKVADEPVYKLAGGAVRQRIQLYANIGLSTDPAEFRRRARHALDMGYRVVKFYPLTAVGPVEGIATLKGIVACCEAVRDECGEQADFALDFHGRLSAGLAVEVEAAVRHTKPLWIEEPVLPETPKALQRVAEKTVIPIAVGERLFTRFAFRDILENEWATIIQPDVANAGGITEMLKIAALAETYGVAFAPHNPNGPVQSIASMHLAATTQPFAMLEHRHEHRDFMRKLASHVPAVEADGAVGLPPGPGLGLTVDEDFARANNHGTWIPESFRADGTIADW